MIELLVRDKAGVYRIVPAHARQARIAAERIIKAGEIIGGFYRSGSMAYIKNLERLPR